MLNRFPVEDNEAAFVNDLQPLKSCPVNSVLYIKKSNEPVLMNKEIKTRNSGAFSSPKYKCSANASGI